MQLTDWLAQRRLWQLAGMAALFGLLIAVGQAPLSQPLLALVGLGLLALLFSSAKSLGRAAIIGWLGGSGYFLGTIFWIMEPFQIDAERYAWMAPFALVLMALGLALFWLVGFAGAYKLGCCRQKRLLALIVTLGLAELARSYVLTGFPWGLLAYIWVETPVMQLAAYIGPHGLGAVTLGLVIIPLVMVMRRRLFVALSVGLLSLGVVYGLGTMRLNIEIPDRPEPLRARLVQPNAAQDLKWRGEYVDMFYNRLLNLSRPEGAEAVDLIIWPETAVRYWLGVNTLEQQRMGALLDPEGKLILGMRRFEGRRVFNSLVTLNYRGEATSVYDKRHLVPFGEYVPFASLLGRFGLRGLAAEDGAGFTAGTGRQLLDLGAYGQVLPLICYESIFPALVNDYATRPDWILQITNDAWFGTLAGPQQHLAQAQVRAIEQGLPFVRVANTGVTALIDARGQIVKSIPLGVAGRIDVEIPGALPRTFYSRTGDWLAAALLILALFGLGIFWRRP